MNTLEAPRLMDARSAEEMEAASCQRLVEALKLKLASLSLDPPGSRARPYRRRCRTRAQPQAAPSHGRQHRQAGTPQRAAPNQNIMPVKTGLWKVNGKTVNQVAHLTVQVQAAVTTLDAAGYWLLLLKQQFFSKHQPGLPSHLDCSSQRLVGACSAVACYHRKVAAAAFETPAAGYLFRLKN
eukprot:CAMPEP_0172657672 /NCGR_PEP_ID=MMETSP1074-20121228/2246_1 /TAXON_ID=2916 /ORGANISM="Ceratium fusus, Strain PA161109" /LENGTH=181 /DNA_ID=CAMNT_0013472797 /DNA_START=43 /DNA_END=589 /DNA_ORIENTATION=+